VTKVIVDGTELSLPQNTLVYIEAQIFLDLQKRVDALEKRLLLRAEWEKKSATDKEKNYLEDIVGLFQLTDAFLRTFTMTDKYQTCVGVINTFQALYQERRNKYESMIELSK
jgi:hypothetical protein